MEYLNENNQTTADERKDDFIDNIDFSIKCNYINRLGEVCNKLARFKFEDETPSKCNHHKLKDMFNHYSKICIEEGCVVIASFKFLGNEEEYFCSKHKKPNTYNFKIKKCIEPNCKKMSSYNEISTQMNCFKQTDPIYCRIHRTDKMINVRIKRCQIEECFNKATYGLVEPTNCKIHRTPFMEFRYYPLCLNEDCIGVAQYNYSNESRVKFCILHKLPQMIRFKR